MDCVLHGGEKNILHDAKDGFGILELCQSLIRNQDYEIFLPGKGTILNYFV